MKKIIANQTDIDIAITKFKEVREDTPETSAFGDNNWSVLDAMIDMLTTKNTDCEEIFEKHGLFSSSDQMECENVFDFLTGVITIELLLEDY